jgi:small-conductance mechanosensitive channel
MDSLMQNLNEILNFTLFTVNQSTITVLSILILIAIIILFMIISKIVQNKILAKIFSKSKVDDGTQYTLKKVAGYIIIFTGVVLAFQSIGVDLSGLAIILGFLSVGIGFGLQNITSNFISGIILLFERPIKVGDRVTVGDVEGDVTDVNIRSTTVRSLNNISIIVPNSEFISSRVTNWSHGDLKVKINLAVGVSYNSDLDLVIRSLKEVAEENKEVLNLPVPDVHLKSFGDSSWDMVLLAWVADPKRYYGVQSDLNCAIVKKFRANNIEIPFPQRDLHIRTNAAGITN